MNIVIMAGGGGTRLWPLSRQDNPKQFLRLDGKKTLLEMTYDRARQVAEPDHIFIATIEEYGQKIQEELPEIKPSNIFYEPQRRDNAAAFASVAMQLIQRGEGDTTTVFMWADHVFKEEEQYITDVKKIPGLVATHPNAIVVVGHVPTYPETGFGYIEAGEKVAGSEDIFTVKSFKEKPDLATAESYIASGRYFWNMGSISLRPNFLIEELRKYEPELVTCIEQFAVALQKGNKEEATKIYCEAKKTSIDYALLERTPKIFVVTGDYGWNDVGNWSAVKDIFGVTGDHMAEGHHIHVDSADNYIYNATNRAVSLIGMKDTIVVVTDDAVLVTHKSKSHKVKDVVAKLEEDNKREYL